MTSELDQVLRDDYLGDLESRPLDEVRAMRVQCQSIETGLSYLRRLVQGRLDIVAGEARHRAEGASSSTVEELIEQLPEILADRTRSPGLGRLPSTMGTGKVDQALNDELDEVLGPAGLASVGELSDDELASVAEALADIERRVSAHRRDLFDRLDALQAEIARRYRTGEADVESLLR